MKKIFLKIAIFFLSIFIFKNNVYALDRNFEIISDKTSANVNEIINIKIIISDTEKLTNINYLVTHSDNLILVSGEEKIDYVVDEYNTKEKQYELSYKAIESGDGFICIKDENSVDDLIKKTINIIDNDNSDNMYETIDSLKKSTSKSQIVTRSINQKKEWVKENGYTYYYINGEMQKGIIEIDGKYYHFGENTGQLKIGWSITLDKKEYFSNETGEMQFGWINDYGNIYYITKEEGAYKGLHEINGKYYHFGENTHLLKKGWSITLDKKEYFSNEDGEMQFGWINDYGNIYYITKEEGAYKGLHEINGKYYHFGENTHLLKKGWSITLDKKEYFSNKDGEMQFGWVKDSGYKYYITKEEGAYKGIYEIEGKQYHFGQNTKQLKIGWSITLDKKEYFSNEDGEMQFGWINDGYSIYYITKEEGAYKGIYEIEGKQYHFGQNTKALKFGWSITLDKKTYYSDNNGVIQTGIQVIDGVSYNFGSDGVLQSGFQTINGKTYYYYSDGSLAKGIVKIQGERDYFDFTTGELLKRNVKSIIDVSYGQSTINWDALWSSGQIDGVIVRIGYGTSRTDDPVLDSYFAYNIASIKRLGIPYSVYIFGYAQTPYAAEKEATFVANALNSYGATNLSMPIFYDAEMSNWRGVEYTSELYTTTINAFANKLKSLGFNNVGVYGSYSWFTDGGGRLNSQSIRSYPLWVAQYYRKCSYTDPLIGWQYTSTGSLPGIPTNVDMSIFF